MTTLAAGGLIVRDTPSGETEVVLVHRPRYDDWTIPKGKLNKGESPEDAAVREVEEETGITAKLGPHLDDVTYTDRHGEKKVVSYWMMHPVTVAARNADDEVDEVRWVPVGEASRLLTYKRDRKLLENAQAGA
jgi:8-oxo-dGTP diphosphatase